MPSHRGIKMSVVSQVELKTHPEFPHPESSQFTYRSPDSRKGAKANADWTPPSASSDSKADRFLGRQSVVSVYIPSMPGSRFWLKYNVFEAAPTQEWFYFKLYMNGRHITSWGTNTKSRPSGQVMRGLFEPNERWNYKHQGTVFRNMGTEARPFMFACEEEEQRSAANDGGLIEVMVFRARGRKRRLPKPTDFKNQEGYGIVMPTAGLLETPQDAKFYDWHLKDPKDNPFVTFKFHYRSWESLTSLQLIPDNHPRTLVPSSPVFSCNGDSHEPQKELDMQLEDEHERTARLQRSLSSTVFGEPWLTSVFDDSPERPSNNLRKRPSFTLPPVSPFARSNVRSPEPLVSKFSTAVIDKSTSPQESPPWLDRPLPEIPPRDSSLGLRRHPRKYSIASVGHSRSSSGVSNALSIAPSLLQELDQDSQSPEVILGVAEIVDVYASPNPNYESPTRSISEFPAFLHHPFETSSPRTVIRAANSKRSGIASPPPDTLFSMTNVTVRKSRRSPGKHLSKPQANGPKSRQDSPCPAPSRFSTQALDSFYADDADQPALEDNTTTLSLSESEWMAHTPSPVRQIPRFGSLQRMWSPGLENRKSRDMRTAVDEVPVKRDSGAGRDDSGQHVLKKKAPNWHEKTEPSDETPFLPGEHFGGSEVGDCDPGMEGNWI